MIFLLQSTTPETTSTAAEVALTNDQFVALGEQINGVGLFLGVAFAVLIAVNAGVLWVLMLGGR